MTPMSVCEVRVTVNGTEQSHTVEPRTLLVHYLREQFPTPYTWLGQVGVTNDFESAVLEDGANGVPLWFSWQAGLDPNDPDDLFRIQIELGEDGASRVLTWDPRFEREYSVEVRTHGGASFDIIPGADLLMPPLNRYTDTVERVDGPVIYRLRVQPSVWP